MTDAEKAEYEDVIRQLMLKLEQLAAENARLRSEKSDALSVLKEIYSDREASQAHRIKAAGLALPHEVPRLMPERAPLDLVGEEIVEPLAAVVERQRARADAMMPEARNIEVSPSGAVRILPKPGGNGSSE